MQMLFRSAFFGLGAIGALMFAVISLVVSGQF